VFGAIEYFSGRLFSQGIEGRFNSESYHAFLQRIMAQTTEHLFLIHDGARYHTSASTKAFLAAHHDRITEHPLPSYSPDYNPNEFIRRFDAPTPQRIAPAPELLVGGAAPVLMQIVPAIGNRFGGFV
jgi:hypothetical protein